MKLNINKVVYLLLLALGIGLGIFTSALSLFTTYDIYSYTLLFATYYLGLRLVEGINKFPLYIKR